MFFFSETEEKIITSEQYWGFETTILTKISNTRKIQDALSDKFLSLCDNNLIDVILSFVLCCFTRRLEVLEEFRAHYNKGNTNEVCIVSFTEENVICRTSHNSFPRVMKEVAGNQKKRCNTIRYYSCVLQACLEKTLIFNGMLCFPPLWDIKQLCLNPFNNIDLFSTSLSLRIWI